MQEGLQNFFTNLSTNISGKWNGLEKPQKTRLIAGIIVLILAIGFTLFFTLRPKYVPLVSNENFETISNVKAALGNSGIKHKVTQNGTGVDVREEDIFEAKIAVSVHTDAEPIMDEEDVFTMNKMFEDTGIGVSESTKKQMTRVALENRLSSIIKKMDGINGAEVVLDIPETNGLFVKSDEQTRASVFITETAPLSKEQASAVAATVIAGVKGLVSDNIVITNQYKEIIFPAPDNEETSEQRKMYEMEIEQYIKSSMHSEVIKLLEPLYSDVRASINITLDNDKIKQEEIIYTPYNDDSDRGVLENKKTSSQSATGNGGAALGEPGVGSNDGMADSYQIGDDGTEQYNANSKTSDENYKVNERKTITDYSTGDLIKEDSSAVITAYQYKTVSEAHMRENNLLPTGMTWYEYKLNYQPTALTVDPGLVDALRIGTGLGNNLSVVAYEVYNFVDEVPAPPTNWQQIALFVILALLIIALAFGLLRRNRQEIDEVIIAAEEPELEVERLLVSNQLEEEKEEEVERFQEIDFTSESDIKRQIDKFVDEKPEAVAQLLRNWLQEGWE